MDRPLRTPDQLRQHLRSLRKQRKLTQSGLGALIGVTQARVVEIEANPGSVSLQQVMQVLHALGANFVVSAAWAHEAPDKPSDTEPKAVGTPASRTKRGSW